jgi:YD repeat-containing protein
MTGLTYPDGRRVAYAWDANNRLSSIESQFGVPPLGGLLATYSYDPAGLMVNNLPLSRERSRD